MLAAVADADYLLTQMICLNQLYLRLSNHRTLDIHHSTSSWSNRVVPLALGNHGQDDQPTRNQIHHHLPPSQIKMWSTFLFHFMIQDLGITIHSDSLSSPFLLFFDWLMSSAMVRRSRTSVSKDLSRSNRHQLPCPSCPPGSP